MNQVILSNGNKSFTLRVIAFLECTPGLFGPNCANHCLCLNGECHPQSGECRCNSGFTGEYCEYRLIDTFLVHISFIISILACPFGLFGRNCNEACNCMNGASCHKVIHIRIRLKTSR